MSHCLLKRIVRIIYNIIQKKKKKIPKSLHSIRTGENLSNKSKAINLLIIYLSEQSFQQPNSETNGSLSLKPPPSHDFFHTSCRRYISIKRTPLVKSPLTVSDYHRWGCARQKGSRQNKGVYRRNQALECRLSTF